MKTLLLVLLLAVPAHAQSNARLRQTWKSPDMSPLLQLLKEAEQNPPSQASDTEVLKFKTAGNSGVAEALADALGRSKKERNEILAEFREFRKEHEAELALRGNPFNLSAAMGTFITMSLLATGRADVTSKEDVPKVLQTLEQLMVGMPAVAAMSEAEKQRLYDWLFYMGMFAFSQFISENINAEIGARSRIGSIAENALQLVLGAEARRLNLVGSRLTVESANDSFAKLVKNIAGAWTISSVQENDNVQFRYIFNADGTYSFKSERNEKGHKTWWTTEETGSFSMDKSSLTISPKVSKQIWRNDDGVVQKAHDNKLETVTYTWRVMRSDNTGEMSLLLQPPKPTSSNRTFRFTSLYTKGDKLEWRF
jgi:hypothetical protein